MLSFAPTHFDQLFLQLASFYKDFREKRDEYSIDQPELHHLVILFILSANSWRSDQFH